MRPTPIYLISGLVAALAALPSAAQLSTRVYSSPATTTGTTATTTGTTATTTGSSSTTTGSSNAMGGTSQSPAATNQSQYQPAGGASSTNAANGTAITGTTTSFGNGARYVVNADGTVTVLSSVPTTTTTNTTTTSVNGTNNALAASVNGNGAFAANGTTTTLNPIVADVNGVAPGQTSSGTAAGNSSLGIVDANAARANGNPLAPGVSFGGGYAGGIAGVDYGAMTDAGSGVNANGERVAMGGAGGTIAVTNTSRTPTPTYDMVARAGMAKELNRRARGQTPRIIGIAPRTNVDRTDQMPDDPVIRY